MNTTATETNIEQRTEWLREFQRAHRDADYALGVISAQIVTLREAGLDGVADRLIDPFTVATAGIEGMDRAVSRMISEDFQHSMKTTDDVFRALLRGLGGSNGNEN